MGVKGLQTFLENSCPEACYRVRIYDLVETYRRETGCEPVIVVDGSSCLRHLYGNMEWITGGQIKEYVEISVNFVRAFEALGVRLVFYFDGATIERKRPTWIQRRLQNLKDVYTIFDILNGGRGLSAINPNLFQLPPGIGGSARYIFRIVCGCEVRTSIRECDEEIAEYARKNNCFAILGQDTDYVIYEGAQYYLSVMQFDINTMTTLNYNRWALARALGIQPGQLPLLASLVGNDIISPDELRNFHRQICSRGHASSSMGRIPFKLIIHQVAQYIRNQPAGHALFGALPAISRTVFHDERKAVQLESSIRSYHISANSGSGKIPVPNDNWGKVLEKARDLHIRCEIPPQIWAVMTGLPYESSTALEDFRLTDLPPSALALKPLRQRVYGILLHEKPCNQGELLVVEEWCMQGPHSLQQPARVIASQVSVPHPGLLALWGANSEAVRNARWQLFATAISPKLCPHKLSNIPLHLVVPTASIYYLNHEVQPPVLSSWELDALAATSVIVSYHNASQLSQIQVGRVDTRAVRIATLYVRTARTVTMLLAACGYPVPLAQAMPWHYFDGKLFHKTYIKAKSGASFTDLCSNQVGLLDHFQDIRQIVLDQE